MQTDRRILNGRLGVEVMSADGQKLLDAVRAEAKKKKIAITDLVREYESLLKVRDLISKRKRLTYRKTRS